MSQCSTQAPTPSGQSQSASRRLTRPTCARCGSRRWRRENNRGVLICSEGHVLEGYLRETTEHSEASQHSTRVRRTKVGKKRKVYYTRKQIYRGEQGRLLLLQLFTILIRKQVEALIEVLQAPTVLEEVAQSFWRAYLTTLSLDADLLFTQPSSPASTLGFGTESQSGWSSSEIQWSNTRNGSQSRPSSSTQMSHEDFELPLTPEALKAMTGEDSNSSDESDGSTPESQALSDGNSQRTPQAAKQSKRRKPDDLLYPGIECTLGILYLVCIRLRLPIIMQDLVNLVITKELPYLGFFTTIPEHMKAKMSGSMISHFSVLKPPKLYTSHGNGLIHICHKLMSRLREVDPSLLPVGESVPNVSLIMLRFAQILLVPSPLHALALHMISHLKPHYLRVSKTSNYPFESTTHRRRTKIQEGPRFPPDWFIMASLVATIKIVLDGLQEPCPSGGFFELLLQSLPHPKQWMVAITTLRDSFDLKNPQKLCEIDVASATGKELDAYIDLAGRFLLSETTESKHAALKDLYFPLSPPALKPAIVEDLGSVYDRISAALLANTGIENVIAEGFKEHAAALVSGVIDRASGVVGAPAEDFRRVLELTSKAFGELGSSVVRLDPQG